MSNSDILKQEMLNVLPEHESNFRLMCQSVPHSVRKFVQEKRFFALPVGGRLRIFIQKWIQETSDPFILEHIRGVKIPLTSRPKQSKIPKPLNMSQSDKDLISQDIQKMLRNKVIKEVIPNQNTFISQIFNVAKKDGGSRSVINLRPLNTNHVQTLHFKMSCMNTVLQMICKGDFLVSIDLEQCYYHYAVYAPHQKYLVFQWLDKFYCCLATPFGLASMPRICTKTISVMLATLRKQNIQIVAFLDDLALRECSKLACKSALHVALKEIFSFGYLPNFKKSMLTPSQRITHLGYIIDTVHMTIEITPEKIRVYRQLFQKAVKNPRLKIRRLAKIIGCCVSLFLLRPEGRLFYIGN